ncbi:SoxR reducing system RseC family protein [Sedimentibacter sp. zth1]|uniref:SoxR reducing system RseC family protein n=1 Tax=Sedimentibacter sp. zth1 TaxID=2816908 RepID=UPI001A916DFE|nr:SoxR reducing system RseC family protein [Sedimentibacter sp. zth1]QSX06425.1 SoxR reducing system RseC family protein [Sedimentibacter sp. zth1]
MDQNGIVKQIKGNKAIVTIKRKTSCGESCDSCSAMCKVPSVNITADLIDGVKVGDTVEVFSEDINVLKYALVLYGLPLLLMVAVILMTNAIFKGENGQLYAGLCGIASLAVSFIILKIYDKKESSKKSFKYFIVKKVEE